MNRLYEKKRLTFALLWIILYVVLLSLGDGLSEAIGVQKLVTAPLSILLSAFLVGWMKKNGLTAHFGLCRSRMPARRHLYYLPLILLVSFNLWGGVVPNLSTAETVLYIISMLCVGVLEELIFRGLLFQALREDNLRQAVVISSLTFGIGHIVNLLSGAPLGATLLQICYAVAIGFLFTVWFLKSGSLLACIVTHGLFNSLSAFSNSDALSPILTAVVLTAVPLSYAILLLKQPNTNP